MPPSVILYAEDEENDVFFLTQALKEAGLSIVLKAVPDGEQAIEYLAGGGTFANGERPLPALILLDINMPRQTGLEVLEWIRRQSHLKSLPVLMLTSSSRPEDMEKARQLGADDYLSKPSHPADLVELVKFLHDRWLSHSESPPSRETQAESSPPRLARSKSDKGESHTQAGPPMHQPNELRRRRR